MWRFAKCSAGSWLNRFRRTPVASTGCAVPSTWRAMPASPPAYAASSTAPISRGSSADAHHGNKEPLLQLIVVEDRQVAEAEAGPVQEFHGGLRPDSARGSEALFADD